MSVPINMEFLKELWKSVKEYIKDHETDQPKDWLQTTGRFFREHPTLALTSLYLYARSLGMVYLFFLFKEFGTRVMDLADAKEG